MEEPVTITCLGKRLYGILHVPENRGACPGVVIMVTGGPQTRYGSHRLYVQLARFLCERGIAVFRFDYEGMGDSEGEFVGAAYCGSSIHAAVHYVDQRFPPHVKRVIWSLCDGATASALYTSRHDAAVSGLLLCNPYIHDRTELYYKHYYTKRLLEKKFWVRLLTMKTKFREALAEVAGSFGTMFMYALKEKIAGRSDRTGRFTIESFMRSIGHNRVPIRCILSDDDVVAQEFRERILFTKEMSALQGNGAVKVYTIDNADHTFTEPDARDTLCSLTATVLRDLGMDVSP